MPLALSTRFRLRVLNFRMPGLVRIGHTYMEDTNEEVLCDMRVERARICGDFPPAVPAQHFLHVPMECNTSMEPLSTVEIMHLS